MIKRLYSQVMLALCGLVVSATNIADQGVSGNIGVQSQLFTQSKALGLKQTLGPSFFGQFEYYKDVQNSNHRFTITPFFRWDKNDPTRSHVDLRELKFSTYTDNHEFEIGIGKVFWGVAESQNIVNIINQRDTAEGPLSTEAQGQAMLHYSYLNNSGNLEFFILPWFRPQTFTGEKGRPGRLTTIDAEAAQFESGHKEFHTDFAVRYSGNTEYWDYGVSYFNGTSRQADLRLRTDQTQVPFYYQVQHFGLDAQATYDNWLLKLEAVHQQASVVRDHNKLVTGFEYSFYGIRDTAWDVGVVAEYIYDGLGEIDFSILQNDLLLGVRLTLNDEQSTEALIVTTYDFESGAQFFTLRGSRRISSTYKTVVEVATFEFEQYYAASLQWYF